jgi:hypothetical protein
MAKGVIFYFEKPKYNFRESFLGLTPQTAALIFLPRVAHSVIIFDRLIGNYYFTLKSTLARGSLFLYYNGYEFM